ncbi:MAG: CPBP family intramembrane metalloprotease [Candidatus Brocadiaceae bacterium]|nr:CPBP family intramembrane metalloprotease [Candidatus Brocadiaceae bacterium]
MKVYLYRSKNLASSFLFILPLLILYEVGIALQGSSMKNVGDVIIKTPLTLFGKNGSLIFNSLVLIFLVISIFYIEKEYQFSSLIFIPMLVESIVYAIFLGFGMGLFVYKVLFPYTLANPFSTTVWMSIILSVGAGVYEEIVFRLLLISALYFIFTNLLKVSKPMGATISVLAGGLIFTVIHYIGVSSDLYTPANFTFRLLSGVILSVIFLFRGLGIAVYTHAVYDVLAVLKPFTV